MRRANATHRQNAHFNYIFALIVFLLAVPRASIAEEFSWQALLGASSENLLTELERFSSCDTYDASLVYLFGGKFSSPVPPSKKYINGLSFVIRHPIPQNAKMAIRDWHDIRRWHDPIPINYSFVDEDHIHSSKITELKCSADMRVRINILLFENNVFDIGIYYDRCDRRASGCDPLAPTSIDRSFASKLPAKPIYFPTYATKYNYSNNELFDKTYTPLTSDLYLKDMLFDAGEHCFYLEADKFRCIVMATADKGVWHSITMTEAFETNWFSERILGRFAYSQRFTLIEVDKRAREAFTLEVRAAIENRERLDHEEDLKRERRESPLKSGR